MCALSDFQTRVEGEGGIPQRTKPFRFLYAKRANSDRGYDRNESRGRLSWHRWLQAREQKAKEVEEISLSSCLFREMDPQLDQSNPERDTLLLPLLFPLYDFFDRSMYSSSYSPLLALLFSTMMMAMRVFFIFYRQVRVLFMERDHDSKNLNLIRG